MGFKLRQNPSGLEMVNEFMKRMKSATEEAKSAIYKAQEDMTQYYNQRRFLAPMFKPGDQVYLDMSNIKMTCPSPKLSHHRLGPFKIKRQVGLLAYHLKLPQGMRQLHLVKVVRRGSGVTRNGAGLLQSGRELTTKWGNNLGLSSCTMP